jgi:hypothetical protein
MTEWFVRRYKRVPPELETVSVRLTPRCPRGGSTAPAFGKHNELTCSTLKETRVYLAYRLQSKDCVVERDKIGRPDRADFVGFG